ncbi:MAG: RNB domain-containing ribonuclease, partial [Bacteroidota bacterium]
MVKKKNTKEVAGPDKEIFAVFQKETKKTFNYKQIAKRLGMNKATSRQEIIMAMARLTKDGRLIQDSPGRYKLSEREAIQLKKHSFIVGKLEMANTGKGFVIPEDGGEDIRISPANLGKALDGDKVKVYLFAKRSGKQSEGEIIDVVERAKPLYVGIIRVSERFAFLMPESKTGTDIFIPLNALKGARDGEKAVARLVDWPDGSKSPVGEITEVLGFPGKTEVEVSAIMIDHNLPIAFSDEVEAEAKKINTTIDEAEIGRRRDFRNITTFTIDPIDAKDFDDALSIREIKKGRWEIGIHIADVSHYVKPGSILDNEAYARATSVYLVDRCVPMLPEILSNGVCSLRPDEEKLCYSAVFEMDESGKVLKEWFGRTVILSKRRFNYDEAQDIVDSGKGDLVTELTFLDSMAKKLRAERFKKGSINFERSEVKFRLDAQGNPTGVFLKENKDSNKLIEEFMLLANRKVAEYCSRKNESSPNRPFVYRTHDDPDPERISEFSRFLK